MNFTHLRVASAYSMKFGANLPHVLVERAAYLGQSALAVTDRNGLYGVVRFAKACQKFGVAPIVGVDFAYANEPVRIGGNPVSGGRNRDPRLPRVVVLASGKTGWKRLCRLVTAVHLGGERGDPVVSQQQLAEFCVEGDLIVVLGEDSDFGAAVASQQRDAAESLLRGWRRAIPRLVVGLTNHHAGGHRAGSALAAARSWQVAQSVGVPAILINSVRMAEPTDSRVVDILDASRRLVPLSAGNADRRNSQCYLKNSEQMRLAAAEICQLAGWAGVDLLWNQTRELAAECELDPSADIGLGQVCLPEFETLGVTRDTAMQVLRQRCEAGLVNRYQRVTSEISQRLDDELSVIGQLGFASYFLTVADVTKVVQESGIRCAARGSGAGSLVNYALGISGVDPIRYHLLFERFLSPLRAQLPDIDIDVESARRLEVYDQILDRFGDERVACVAMVETYRARHAIRDVGAALSLPPTEIDSVAKAFPHIRARHVPNSLAELPELQGSGLSQERLRLLFDLVVKLDGLPRQIALHPCGIILSDAQLGDRTPIERSAGDYPISQFDKDDVEDLGLLKLDVLGVRMQSAMAYAVAEAERVSGRQIDLDALAPYDDPDTYELIQSGQTLGCFQIESPGQRELVGKFAPADFADIIIDISLFRPGPVKADMIRPFLSVRQGFAKAEYLHPDLIPVLAETSGVVVFHEQVIQILSRIGGCSLAEADVARRALGDEVGLQRVRKWFHCSALQRGYPAVVIDQIWRILAEFSSFGFCKAHAAAFALPSYQSAWLKRHYPSYFLAGVLTHDPGMYPKRLLLAEARRLQIPILGLSINRSRGDYRVELTSDEMPGIRLSLSDVSGISAAEISQIEANQPYDSLSDFRGRVPISQPTLEKLILVGAFDELYSISFSNRVNSASQVSRRDLLLQAKKVGRQGSSMQAELISDAEIQLASGDLVSGDIERFGLPEFTDEERLATELEILGLDASAHVFETYRSLAEALGYVPADQLLQHRGGNQILVAGVKVATQTPPVRSGKRVIFMSLDDGTGCSDSTFFPDVQSTLAKTVFSSWIFLVAGELRRTGPKGVSIRATGCWDLVELNEIYLQSSRAGGDGLAAVRAMLNQIPEPQASPARHRVLQHANGYRKSPYADVAPAGEPVANSGRLAEPMRKLWHTSPGSSGS